VESSGRESVQEDRVAYFSGFLPPSLLAPPSGFFERSILLSNHIYKYQPMEKSSFYLNYLLRNKAEKSLVLFGFLEEQIFK